jgi:uncharacterized protein (TIGR02246 family)
MSNDVVVDRSEIARRSLQLLAAVNAADLDRVVAIWADDGIMMPPNHASLVGRGAITDYFRTIFASGARFEFAFTSSDVDVGGDIAVERLTYTMTVSRDGAAAYCDRGKGVHVYRRDKDGTWRLAYDIWNSDTVAG